MINNISFPKLGIEFNINPIAIKIGEGGVHWYGIIIAVGIILAVLYCSHIAKKEGENPENVTDLVLWALPVSVVFARTYYVLFSWDSYKDNPIDIFKIWEGGIAIYGAIIGAVLTAYIFCRVKKINPLKFFDICSLGLLIGQAVGRWGNFVNGEAFGGECAFFWGMSINGGEIVHPTFLYESLWNTLVFVLLAILHKKRPFYGFTFFMYMTLYSIGRFFIESMRADSLYLGNLRVSQLLAFILMIVGIISLVLCRKNDKLSRKKE